MAHQKSKENKMFSVVDRRRSNGFWVAHAKIKDALGLIGSSHWLIKCGYLMKL